MGLNSSLYSAQVMHHRLLPKEHRFIYNIFMFYLDLDELNFLNKKTTFLSRNRFNLYNFRDSDHMNFGERDLKENVFAFLSQKNGTIPKGKVMLLTHLRTLGHLFNPVSFYFCFDEKNSPACAIAEVGNTYREMKLYFIPKKEGDSSTFYERTKKYFYVSPFIDLDVDFEFKLETPRDELNLWINDYKDGRMILTTSLIGKKVPLNAWNILKLSFLSPLVTLKVISAIHWNALLLYLKGISHYPKNENLSQQKDVLNRV